MVDLEALGYLVRDPLANHPGADRMRGLPARAARRGAVLDASGKKVGQRVDAS